MSRPVSRATASHASLATTTCSTAGSEVDLRRFRGSLGRRVAVSLLISILAAAIVTGILLTLGVGGAALIGVALLATSLGLVVPVLADAGQLTARSGGSRSPVRPRARWLRWCRCRWDWPVATPRSVGGCYCSQRVLLHRGRSRLRAVLDTVVA